MATRITDSFISATVRLAVAEARRIDTYDALRAGLILRVTPGGVISWAVLYRPKNDRQKRRMTLGPYRATATGTGLSIAEARSRAAELLNEVAAGRDPGLEAKAERKRLIDELAERERRQRALAERITIGELVKALIADQERRGIRSRHENARSLNKELRGYFNTAVADVTPAVLERVMRHVEERGSRTEAARLYSRLSTLFAFAVPTYIEASPLDKVTKRAATNVRKRFLSPAEVRAFLVTLPQAPMTERMRNILRLQLLLGARVSEVAGMCKGEVDLVAGNWVLPPERAKNGAEHVIPLPPEARRVIIAAMRASKHQSFIFPSESGETHVRADTVAQALARWQTEPRPKDVKAGRVKLDERLILTDARTGKPNPFTSHDLRRTCATYLEALGHSEKLIGGLLNHRTKKEATLVGRVYSQAEQHEKIHEALCGWEGAIRQIVDGGNPFAVDLDARRKREAEIVGEARPLMITGPSA